MDISATIQKDSHESTTQKGSSLLAGGNLVIKSGSTAKIEGSDTAAQGDILIDARNVEITAAKNTEKTHSTSYTEHLNFTASYATNNSWGINGDTSHTWSNSESESRVNSHLNANNITIKSVKDTTVRGGVVAANDSLDLDVGGNLVVASLQDKSSSSSYSYGVNGGYSETRDKDNNKTGSGNGGANFSVSMSERKWVTEQTSLTGSHVNIYVEKKTALTGAVIASTSNDLTLDTGSFEYSDIKGKDISWNGGLTGSYGKSYVTKTDGDNNDGDKSNSAKYNTWSASLTYGYSERRQTNFATIGEGTIIVRDGNGSLASLKRDVSKSQYGTVDMGFQGGLTVDSSTVAMVKTLVTTNPKDIYNNVKTELVKGYEDAAKTTEDIYAESIIMYQKTTNLISEGHFVTDSGLIVVLDKKASEKYWNDVKMIKEKYQSMFDGTIKNNYFFYAIDENGKVSLIPKTIHLGGDRSNGLIIGALDSAGQVMNEWGAKKNVEIASSRMVVGLNKTGVYLNEHPEKAIWVCFGAAAVGTGVPILIGSMPAVSGLIVTEGVKNAAIMGTINGSVQVGSNILVNNDYTINGNSTAFGAGFITGALLSRVGSSANPILMNLGTGIVSTVGDLGSQSAMNIQAGKSAATDLNYTKAFFVGSMRVFGLNITAPIINGATKLTFPEKAAVGTMFLAPTSVGSDILFNKNK